MNVTWTVAATYQPFSYDDYFYEGSEEKIKVTCRTTAFQ